MATASRYTGGMRYDPTLSTGRYPLAPVVAPITPAETVPTPAPAVPAPSPQVAPPEVSVGAEPVERERPQGGEGSGVGSGVNGSLGESSLGGMPGPSPDQSLEGMGRAALTGLGFAVSPVSTFAGILAGLAYDGMKGNPAGTTTGLRGILADQLTTTGTPVGMTGETGLGKPDAAPTGVDYAAVPGPEKGPDSEGMGTGGGSQPDAVGAAMASAQGDYGALADAALGMGMGGGWGANYGETGSVAGYGGYGGYGGEGAGGTGTGGPTDAVGAGMAGAQGDYGGMAEAAAGMGLFQDGGYTGAGPDAMVQPDEPAGTVHEGEVVLSAPAVDYYGPELLLMLNEMEIPRSRLAALVRGE